MPAEGAAKWAREWAGVNREHGCLLWPSGAKFPEKLVVSSRATDWCVATARP
jgi:hypothetical protein